jgi:branched-chain amino acid aminotransferase
MNPQTIWLDGKWVAWDEANVHLMTHSLHYGSGVFEGIRAYKISSKQSAIFRLQDHIQRLLNSAKILGINTPYTLEEICQACKEVMIRNQLEEGYIRPIIFIGTGGFGINPAKNTIQVGVAAWKWGTYLGKEALEKGIKTKISSFTRFSPNSAMLTAKITGNYALSVLAKTEAIKQGCEEAILLDNDGYVAEGSGENIFIVTEGQLRTPPRMSILPGITRDSIISLAKDMGLSICKQRFGRDLLYTADEAFFTGTAAEVTPIYSVDDRIIGQGKVGTITAQLQQSYFKLVHGEIPKYEKWLSYYQIADSAHGSHANATTKDRIL